MKKLLLVCIIVFISIGVQAQFTQNHAFYMGSGVSLGNFFGGQVNLNYMYQGKYSMQIGYSQLLRKARSQPSDYHNNLFISLFTFGLANPKDQLESIELLAGRVIVLNDKGTVRLNLKGGFTYSSVIEPTNWQPILNTSLSQENYTYDFKTERSFGIAIKPEIEVPLFQVYGWSISPFVYLNNNSIAYGTQFNSIIGLLRRK